MLGHLLSWKVIAHLGEPTSAEAQVGAQSDPAATGWWGHYKHAHIHSPSIHSEVLHSHCKFLVCLFLWRPVPVLPWYLIKALEAIFCGVIKPALALPACLPRGLYLSYLDC